MQISEANVLYQNSAVIWGTHTPPTQRTLGLKIGIDGQLRGESGQPLPGVSFIYGRQ